MGKIKQLEVEYDKIHYQPGDELNGRVKVEFKSATKITGIKLLVYGRAKVHWNTGGRDPTHYRAAEVYINKLISLHRPAKSDTHPGGLFYYPFKIALPESIPSTFQGSIGYVRYYCKVTVDMQFSHETREADFIVFTHINLNIIPDFKEPKSESQNDSVSCCCCTSGNISASFRINRQAFVPGEAILINGEIHNGSNAKMTTTVRLTQIVLFYGYSDSVFSSGTLKPGVTSTSVAMVSHQPFHSGDTDVWLNDRLVIPQIPTSLLPGCKIINIMYVVEMHINVNWGSGPTLEIPVLIGSVPYMDEEDLIVTSGMLELLALFRSALENSSNQQDLQLEEDLRVRDDSPPDYDTVVSNSRL